MDDRVGDRVGDRAAEDNEFWGHRIMDLLQKRNGFLHSLFVQEELAYKLLVEIAGDANVWAPMDRYYGDADRALADKYCLLYTSFLKADEKIAEHKSEKNLCSSFSLKWSEGCLPKKPLSMSLVLIQTMQTPLGLGPNSHR